MQYLGVAVLGVVVLGTAVLGAAVLGTAVLGVAMLGTAVLHPHTRSLSTQHTLTPLFPTRASQSTESHGASRWSSDVQYLGVAVLGIAVLGIGVLGAAVLGTAVLHPHTRSLSEQHSLTPLFQQSISIHGVA